jgi:uncharacterized membrane protein SpoIIM required for sporulation
MINTVILTFTLFAVMTVIILVSYPKKKLMYMYIEIFIHEVDNIYTNVVDPSYCSYNNVVTSCIFCESMVVGFTTIYAISAYHH